MTKRVAQVVALMLAVVGILNAQCFASCSMLLVPDTESGSDHSCCPHHKNSPDRPHGSSTPCTQTKAEKNAAIVAPAPIAITVELVPQLTPPRWQARTVVRQPLQQISPTPPPFITALRI